MDDIPEAYGVQHEGVRLLVMGKSKEAAAGCYCPEHVLLRRLISHLILRRDEVVILDMEAGIEHLTRGTAERRQCLHRGRGARPAEPADRPPDAGTWHTGSASKRSSSWATRSERDTDKEFIPAHLTGMKFLGFMSYADDAVTADLDGRSPYDASPRAVMRQKIKASLDQLMKK